MVMLWRMQKCLSRQIIFRVGVTFSEKSQGQGPGTGKSACSHLRRPCHISVLPPHLQVSVMSCLHQSWGVFPAQVQEKVCSWKEDNSSKWELKTEEPFFRESTRSLCSILQEVQSKFIISFSLKSQYIRRENTTE